MRCVFRMLASSHHPSYHHPRIQNTRLYATRRRSANAPPLSPLQRILTSRLKLLQSQPLELMRIAGVSFEGRQEAVSQLTPNQPVMFSKEPHNEFDPNAVAIHSLHGVQLGYVPRERTGAFIHPVTFGKVATVGHTSSSSSGGESPLWGAMVEVQPRVPGINVPDLPRQLAKNSVCRLSMHLAGQQWEEYKARVVSASGGRCMLTGVPNAAVTEQWEVDDVAKIVRLVGFVAEAPDVTELRYSLLLGSNDDSTKSDVVGRLKSVLAQMNGWSTTERAAEEYIHSVQRRMEERSKYEDWKLEVKAFLHSVSQDDAFASVLQRSLHDDIII